MIWILLTITVVATTLSDLLQSYEMKRAGAQSVGARGMARLLRMIVERRYLLLSIVCLAFSFFVLQSAPLSFAVPASAASFILETVLAKLLLKERIGARRAAGTLLVLCGVALLGR
jgi:drug/metabolite transporter (DMT)-like permease